MGISESKMARWKARLQPMQAGRLETKPSTATATPAAAASKTSSTSRLEGEKPHVSEFERWTAGEPYLHPHGLLLEGPFYESASDVLRFIDIKRHLVHSVSLKDGPASLVTVELDGPVGVTADIAGVDPAERIVVGMRHGLAVMDRKKGTYEYVAKYSAASAEGGAALAAVVDDPRTRSNDGAADINGRYWIGTMTDFGLDLEAEGKQPT